VIGAVAIATHADVVLPRMIHCSARRPLVEAGATRGRSASASAAANES
jgi:hypothetical protein